ncbi:hypothetical protein TIFTF001_027652 [Ficus carica]|uniref:Uncharacterized protein n=1 Tax=Ficus carica TaxID=3494 RepID=A0AA88DNF0_FICCA|nr:hypothetical protein TIFTF001_025978 [Ficus carica]GMN58562.1 hypothetical protein TIFTF001_027652 [Ficus carica]
MNNGVHAFVVLDSEETFSLHTVNRFRRQVSFHDLLILHDLEWVKINTDEAEVCKIWSFEMQCSFLELSRLCHHYCVLIGISVELMKVGAALGLKAIQQMFPSYKEGQRGGCR